MPYDNEKIPFSRYHIYTIRISPPVLDNTIIPSVCENPIAKEKYSNTNIMSDDKRLLNYNRLNAPGIKSKPVIFKADTQKYCIEELMSHPTWYTNNYQDTAKVQDIHYGLSPYLQKIVNVQKSFRRCMNGTVSKNDKNISQVSQAKSYPEMHTFDFVNPRESYFRENTCPASHNSSKGGAFYDDENWQNQEESPKRVIMHSHINDILASSDLHMPDQKLSIAQNHINQEEEMSTSNLNQSLAKNKRFLAGLSSSGDADRLANIWTYDYKRLKSDQQLFAKKAITDILFQASLGNLRHYSNDLNKLPRRESIFRAYDVLPVDCKFHSNDEVENLAKLWAIEYKRLKPDQQLYAKKAISDILFEAKLGALMKNSVKIIEPAVVVDPSNTKTERSSSNHKSHSKQLITQQANSTTASPATHNPAMRAN